MDSGLLLGRIWGVPIRLHISWFLIAGLVTWSLASGYFPAEYPALSAGVYWLLGAVTAVLFAASVLLHELGHVRLALRNQVPVRGVNLFLFGGVAQITREPQSAGAEFRIAIAGPLVSLALAGLFGGLWLLDQAVPLLAAPSAWLARINLSLALFNLLPGFPLDGGRVLRSIVWRITGSLPRATQVSAGVGQLVAFGFIAFGVYTVFTGGLFDGLWLAFIGWFLQNAAASSLAQSTVQQSLRGVRVEQVMNPSAPQVSPLLRLDKLVEENVLAGGGQRTFLVIEEISGRLKGLVTLREVAAVPRKEWPNVTVGMVMLPVERLAAVDPQLELMSALQKMDDQGVGHLPVLDQGTLRGLLSREQVLHYLRLRAEIGM